MDWDCLLLLFFVTTYNKGIAREYVNEGLQSNRSSCTCRQHIQCVGDFDSIEEMNRNKCELEKGITGLCCKDTIKRKAPNRHNKGKVGNTEKLGLPYDLSEDDSERTKGPGDILEKAYKENKYHQSLTQAREEDNDITEAALWFLQSGDENEEKGIGITNSKLTVNINIAVTKKCPWSSTRKPSCGKKEQSYRTVDGSCNNLENHLWGMASTPMKRLLENGYRQPGSKPRVAEGGEPLPSARAVANAAFMVGDTPNSKSISTLFMQMGQFVTHDVTRTTAASIPEGCCLTLNGNEGSFPDQKYLDKNKECFPIEIPRNDPFWSSQGRTCLTFSRAKPSPSIPLCSSSSGREPGNFNTHWLDGSTIYGSTTNEATAARDVNKRSAFLKGSTASGSGKSMMLPQCARKPSTKAAEEACRIPACQDEDRKCAHAGDFRVNATPGLSTMHTIWMREHNRIAETLSKLNGRWDPERVFQETRRIVIAEMQMIVYNEYLPIVFGQQYMNSFSLKPLKPGQGYTEDYDVNLDPRINVEFAGAAFRFGHSMVPSLNKVKIPGKCQEDFSLRNWFLNPSKLQEPGFVDGIVLGQSLEAAPALDRQFSGDIMNHLFAEVGAYGGKDLPSFNIQRGRDFGIQGYNKYRRICASGPYKQVSTFDELTKDGYLSENDVNILKNLYKDINDIDLYVAGVMEKPHKEALLGPIFLCLMGDQFDRFKRGDRFWFENGDDPKTRFSLQQLDSIRQTSMARILCDNTDIGKIQPIVFRTEDTKVNQMLSCKTPQIPKVDLNLWKE